MRVLAIGDIHGCSRAFDTLISAVAPTKDDRIVALGDFVDWGPDSAGVLDRIIELRSAVYLVTLRGNHEEMMLRARDDPNERALWLRLGGQATLDSYDRGVIPERHWDFLQGHCVDFFETASHIFVHGGLNPELPPAQQPVSVLRWKTFRDIRPHESGKVLVCGHTEQPSGWPGYVGHSVCIDTAAYRGGWLTCLDTTTSEFWQANQRGNVRRGTLFDLRNESGRAESP